MDRGTMRVKCLAQNTAQCPAQGSNPDGSIRSPAHQPLGHCISQPRILTQFYLFTSALQSNSNTTSTQVPSVEEGRQRNKEK